METFSALLALCAGNSPATGEFPSQRPVTRSFDDFFDLRLNKRLSKQSRPWWFVTPSRQLWRHCNCILCMYHDSYSWIIGIDPQHIYAVGTIPPHNTTQLSPVRRQSNMHSVLLKMRHSRRRSHAIPGSHTDKRWRDFVDHRSHYGNSVRYEYSTSMAYCKTRRNSIANALEFRLFCHQYVLKFFKVYRNYNLLPSPCFK